MSTEPETMTIEILESMFGEEGRYGIRPDVLLDEGEELDEDADYASVFPDGNPAVFCTGFTRYVRRVLGTRAALFGYDADENPQSFIAVDAGGHDFSVVDDRFIVDFWAKDMGYTKSVVIDLEDAEYAAEVTRLYGPQDTWVPNEVLEQDIDAELPEWRAKYMEGVDLTPRNIDELHVAAGPKP